MVTLGRKSSGKRHCYYLEFPESGRFFRHNVTIPLRTYQTGFPATGNGLNFSTSYFSNDDDIFAVPEDKKIAAKIIVITLMSFAVSSPVFRTGLVGPLGRVQIGFYV